MKRIELRGPLEDPYLILVDDNLKRILYYLSPDPGDPAQVTDVWIPLIVSQNPNDFVIGDGLDTTDFSAESRKGTPSQDPRLQLSYKGCPLYYFDGIPSDSFWQIARRDMTCPQHYGRCC